MISKEITKNLLKGKSCNNCKISKMGNFSAGTGKCKVYIVNVSPGRLMWKEPNLGICEEYV
jgi:hypothetical protein